MEGFYDYHDVWHFFSACGMFFAFLVSMINYYYVIYTLYILRLSHIHSLVVQIDTSADKLHTSA